MTKKRVKKRFLYVIIGTSIINALIMGLWFYLKVSPIFPNISTLKDDLNYLEYNTYDEYQNYLEGVTKKYRVYYSLEEESKESKDNDIILYSKIIKIDNESYLLNIYPKKNLSIASLTFDLFVFQVLIVTLILCLAFIFTRQTIFKPVDKIIKDIRNYKFGKKPLRKKLKNEFDLIQNEFVNLTDMLEDEKKEQNRIIASISHDIKTPLTSIIGYSDLLIDSDINENDIKEYSKKINKKALHIKEILTSFDDYLSNQENYGLKLDVIEIKDLEEELINDYKVELESKNILFEINCDIEVSYLKIDILKIKRVFSNIISNSLRYLPDTGGKITIDIIDSDPMILFKVSDNGSGVDENIIDKIFNPLFTTDSSRKISGLGLSICKEFIEAHGGTINCYNKSGLTIEFTIPKYDMKE